MYKNKNELRKHYLSLRNNLDEDYVQKASDRVCSLVKKYIENYIAHYNPKELYIYGYMPLGKEVSLLKLFDDIWQNNLGYKDIKIHTAFPKVENKNMSFYIASSYDDFEPGHFGVREPKKGCKLCDAGDILVLVPAVAFDKSGYRMGYGKGYYDRYFERRRFESILLGIAYKEQIADSLVVDMYDIRMNKIITN